MPALLAGDVLCQTNGTNTQGGISSEQQQGTEEGRTQAGTCQSRTFGSAGALGGQPTRATRPLDHATRADITRFLTVASLPQRPLRDEQVRMSNRTVVGSGIPLRRERCRRAPSRKSLRMIRVWAGAGRAGQSGTDQANRTTRHPQTGSVRYTS